MKIESLEEAIRISDLTGLPLKVLLPEKMTSANGGISEFDNLSEKDKEYFRKRYDDWNLNTAFAVELERKVQNDKERNGYIDAV